MRRGGCHGRGKACRDPVKPPQLPGLRGEPWARRSEAIRPRPHGGEDSPQGLCGPTAQPLGRRACPLKFLLQEVAEWPFPVVAAPLWWRVGGLSHTGTTRGLRGRPLLSGPALSSAGWRPEALPRAWWRGWMDDLWPLAAYIPSGRKEEGKA